jgi:hypothetical protein
LRASSCFMPYGIMPDSARQEGSATTYGLINSVDHSPGAKDDVANAVAGVIAVGAVPENTVTCESLDSFFGRTNPDNFAMVNGEQRYVGPPPNIVPHPTKGLPTWMR